LSAGTDAIVNRPPPDPEVERIALELEHYVSLHPTAADTPEGIARWWLVDHGSPAVNHVEAALDLLVQRGSLRRQVLPDGNSLYLSARRSPENPVPSN
jgi:hypothetical protein